MSPEPPPLVGPSEPAVSLTPKGSSPAPKAPPALHKPASSPPPEGGPAEPPPAPPPPVVALRVPNEDKVAEEVHTSLAKAEKLIGTIDGSRLSRDQREIFSSIRDFLAKAKEAYQAKDMSRAQVLAEKASKLAEDLAGSIRH
jgi:hypothetical protein